MALEHAIASSATNGEVELTGALGPTLSVIVPATNEPGTLERCRAAVSDAYDQPDEVIVVSSPDLPLAEARNLGARQARGAVLVFVDADVLVDRDAFTRIRAAFAQNPDLTAVFGAYDDRPPAPGAVSGFRNLLHHHVHRQAAGPALTFWTGLGAVAREDFLSVGGFDAASLRWPQREANARDFMADVEFGMRLTASGGRIILDPTIQGTHLKRWSLSSMVRTDFLSRGVPWTRLLLRRRCAPAAMNLAWCHRLSALASLSAAWATVARRPWIAGWSSLLLVLLNRSFYTLMLRRRGARQTVAAVGLHVIYHLTALLSALTGLLIHLLERRSETQDIASRLVGVRRSAAHGEHGDTSP